MGTVLFPNRYPCGDFISVPEIDFTSLNLNNLTSEMAIYWRVKTWKATITVTPGPNNDGSSGPLGTFYQYGRWNADSEEELCCHKSTEFILYPSNIGFDISTFGFAFLNEKPYFRFAYWPVDEPAYQLMTSFDYGGYIPAGVITVQNFSPPIKIMSYTTNDPPTMSTINVGFSAEEYWSYS